MNTIEEIATNQATDSALLSEGGSVHHCDKCGESMPALQCDKCSVKLRLRCFVRRASSDRYIAECIDLDISAEAETQRGAVAGLQDAMWGYLSVVLEDTNTTGLLLRPSPPSHRIRYHFEYLKDKFRELFFQPRPQRRTEKKYYEIIPSPGFRCSLG